MSGPLCSRGDLTQVLACLNCRRLKVKCLSGANAECKRCVTAGLECVMPTHDERKRPSSKNHIYRLEQRVLQLEEELRAQRVQAQTRHATNGRKGGHQNQNDEGSEGGDTPFLDTPSCSANGDGPAVNALLSQMFSPRYRLVDDVSGSSHYFGPTASLHLTLSLDSLPSVGSLRDISDMVEEPKAGGLHEELMSTFWRDHNSILPIVHREAFLSAMQNGYSLYYSKALFYAMCTCAAFITDSDTLGRLAYNSNITPETICSNLIHKASQLLQIEILNPRITTIQTLHILALCELMQGNFARGWLLCGNACRLIYDLGLHQVVAEVKSPLGSEIHNQTCQIVCWGSMILDRLWSGYLGRPYSVNIADIKVPRPRSSSSASYDMQIFGALTEISELSGYVLDFLNDVHSSNLNVERIGNQLARWHSSLPSALQYSVDGDLEVKLLHLHYYSTVIVLYRPFAGLGQFSSSVQTQSSSQSSIFRSKCAHSATMIAHILKGSSDESTKPPTFTIFGLHTISTAASFLIADLADQKKVHPDGFELQREHTWALQYCLTAIDGMEGTQMPSLQVHKIMHCLAWLFDVTNALPPSDEILCSSSKNDIASVLFPNMLPTHTNEVLRPGSPKTHPPPAGSVHPANLEKPYASYDLLHDGFFQILIGTAPLPI